MDAGSLEREDAGSIEPPDTRGWVYVLRNPSMPHRVKIGWTTDVAQRVRELSSVTGVPEPFAVVASFETPWARRVEQEVHRRLREWRVLPRKEFFYASPDRDRVTSAEIDEYFKMVIRQAAEAVEIQMKREALERRDRETYLRHYRESVAYWWHCMRKNRPPEQYPKGLKSLPPEALGSVDRFCFEIYSGDSCAAASDRDPGRADSTG